MGWLLNRAGISVPDLTSDGYYQRCKTEPDHKWGEHLAPLLALAFQVSGGVANHVGFVMQNLGSKQVILNATTEAFSTGLGFQFLKWFSDNVLEYAYANVDARFLTGQNLAAIVRSMKPYMIHQFDNSTHGDRPVKSHVPFYREHSRTHTVIHEYGETAPNVEVHFPSDSTVLIFGVEPGSIKVFWKRPAPDNDVIQVAVDVDDNDGTGHFVTNNVLEYHDWTGSVTYNPGGLQKATLTLEHSGDSETRDFYIEYTILNEIYSPDETYAGAIDRAYNKYVDSDVRRTAFINDYRNMNYGAMLVHTIGIITYWSEFDSLNDIVFDDFMLSRFTHFMNSYFDPASDNPDKMLEDLALYLDSYTEVIYTDRLQKLMMSKLGLKFEAGLGVEYRSDWEVRYLPRGKVNGVQFDFSGYAKAITEVRNPSRGSIK
jgi:hypothetical protein